MTTATIAPERLGSDVTSEDRFGFWYRNGDRKILVTPLVTEELLATEYIKMHTDGTLNTVFHEANPSMMWFLQHYTRDSVCALACMKEDSAGRLTPFGLGWVVNKTTVGIPPVFYKAEIGEFYHRKSHPLDCLWAGRRMIDYCFMRMDLSAIYGSTPERNPAAVAYARKLEFNVLGPFPYYTAWLDEKTGQREACGAFISVMSKDQWEQRSWR